MSNISKTIRNTVLVLFFISCGTRTLSQDLSRSTITWEADEASDLQANTQKAMQCSFTTINNKKLIWTQRKGELKTTYEVLSVSGTWKNISSIGSIRYGLDRNGKYCEATIEKNNEGTFITMDFSKANEYTARLRFRIKSVNK